MNETVDNTKERFPITVSHRPWEVLRAFWGKDNRLNVLAWMTGLKRSSAYKLMEEYGDFGSGRKSDLHRVCEQVEHAVATAHEDELPFVRAIAELPLRVYNAACDERRQHTTDAAAASDAKLHDELTDVIRARLHGATWKALRQEMLEAVTVLEREIAAGDKRERCRPSRLEADQ